jgi:hypothetical protein
MGGQLLNSILYIFILIRVVDWDDSYAKAASQLLLSMYDFQKGEPAILVELFLPYKAKYQGALYETLSTGLKLHKEKYASHFNSEHKDGITKMLHRYGITGNYQDFITRNRLVFTGYSTYEVHGVFCGKDGEPIEEQTTVIKIIFKPNYDELTDEIIAECSQSEVAEPSKEFLEEFLSNLFRIGLRNSYRDSEITPVIGYTALAGIYDHMDPAQRQHCVKKVRDWIEDVGLFLFGYIVYNLSHGVEDREEEIWVTSHWNFYVNRVTRADLSTSQ